MKEKLLGLLKRKKLLALIIVVLLIVGFGVYKISANSSSQVSYQTSAVQKGTIVSTVTASGQVLSTNIVSVSTQATGTIGNVYVKDGDVVTAGQKIMDINLDSAGQAKSAQTYASYLSAKANLDSANATLYSLQSTMLTAWDTYMQAAQSSTYQNADSSPNTGNRQLPQFAELNDNWLAAQAKYQNQQGVIAQAQAALSSSWLSYEQSSSTVTAPIAGTITNITYIPGMVISPLASASDTSTQNSRVAVVQNNSTPNGSVNVSEVDVYKVQNGQPATITLDSIPDETFTGKVISVDRIGGTSSNVTNYPTVIQFDTGSARILPNMAMTANIIVDSKSDVLLVPSAAVQMQNGTSTVRVLTNGQVSTKTVETGLTSDTQTEITSGLSEGEMVITGTTRNSASTTTTGRSIFSGNVGGGFGGGGGAVRRGN